MALPFGIVFRSLGEGVAGLLSGAPGLRFPALHLFAHAAAPLLARFPPLFDAAFGGRRGGRRGRYGCVGSGTRRLRGGGEGGCCGFPLRAGLFRLFPFGTFAPAGLLTRFRLTADVGEDIEVLLVIDTDTVLLESLVFVVAVDGT